MKKDINNDKTSLFKLFRTFASIGVITFGGGYAMLPFLEREVVQKNKWADDTEILDYYSLSQCTPGIIAVNVSTFIGYKERGVKGAIAATLGMVFPSLVIITAIAAVLTNFQDNQYVSMAFSGIRVTVCAMITNSIIKLSKKSIVDKTTIAIFIAILISLFLLKVSTILVVLIGIVLGLLTSALKKISKTNGGNS
ncbi:MAG: chromate transporter [Sphaerochaetaceae bacterium]|nr:chromate transporter [Sphaerochaetaceae bacterium]